VLIHRLAPPVLTLLRQYDDARHLRDAPPISDERTAALALGMLNGATKHASDKPWFEEGGHALRYIALERPHDSALFTEYAVSKAIAAGRDTLQTARFKKWPSLEGTAKVALREIEQARCALGL
jgi:hypothetical protein